MVDLGDKAEALRLAKQGVKKLGRRIKMRGNRVVGRGSNPIDDFIKGFRFDGKGINTIGDGSELKGEGFFSVLDKHLENQPLVSRYGLGMTTGKRDNEGIGDMFQRMRREDKDAEAAKDAEYKRQTKQNIDDFLSGKYGNGFLVDEAIMGLYKAGKKANEFAKTQEAEKAVKAEAFKKRMAEIDRNNPFPKNPEMEKLLGYGFLDFPSLSFGELMKKGSADMGKLGLNQHGKGFLDDIYGGMESAANWADDNINPLAAIARRLGGDIQSATRYGRGKGGGKRATHRMPDGSMMLDSQHRGMSEHRKHILEGRGFLDDVSKLKYDREQAEPPFSWIEKERCDAMGECDGRYKRGRNAFADILGEGM
jgi:hypothetical protein